MNFTTLGRTGLKVSRAGLGCGGPSRLGQSYQKTADESQAVVTTAIELGINLIDTAEGYHTEEIVGRAITGFRRDELVISTKKGVQDWGSGKLLNAAEMVAGLHDCRKRLGLETIDIFHLHGLGIDHYEYAVQEIVPALNKERAAGAFRFLAVSEAFHSDRRHQMLQRALMQDVFDVVMVGLNLLNPSARKSVLPLTRERRVGSLAMFAVRKALSQPERLKEVIAELVASGAIERDALDPGDPLGFLGDVRDAAYRFVAHEPGIDVVLTGTGNPEHLRQNVASINAGPLPAEQQERLARLFGELDSLSGG